MNDDRGYTDRPVRQLSIADLLEEALQVRHSAGYYAGVLERGGAPDEYEPLLIDARDRRNACFTELERRLMNAAQLGTAVSRLLQHREAGNEHPVDWQRLIEAWEASR
jgi:hypothetical protein